jgi:hypothetical protein
MTDGVRMRRIGSAARRIELKVAFGIPCITVEQMSAPNFTVKLGSTGFGPAAESPR